TRTTAETQVAMEDEDPFDHVLQLESHYQAEGYALGVADGTKAGHAEGYAFGIEKGFEKFMQMGVVQGRAAVWEARVAMSDYNGENTITNEGTSSSLADPSQSGNSKAKEEGDDVKSVEISQRDPKSRIPALQPNERLLKHLGTLHSHTDNMTMSLENTEEAVDAFDERLRKATAKVKVIEKTMGEKGFEKAVFGTSDAAAEEGRKPSTTGLRIRPPPAERQMEDFGI
ncbi:hypothetical protein P152DRAFT_399931, partial [Eremomyces bilateralis CBS 781.70]